MTLPELPEWAKPSCAQLPALSFTYGALTAATGLDRLFGGFQAGPGVHWALAGGLADYQCKKVFVADQQLAMCMAAGFVGGAVAKTILG